MHTILTSFNEKYWQEIAKDNTKLLDKHWPKNDRILLYHQLQEIDTSLSDRVQWIDLYIACPELPKFVNQWQDDPRANGKSNKKNAFRWNAIKFAHKTFAIWHAAKKIKKGWLIWIDCDAFIFQNIDNEFLNKIFPKNKHLCYLGRKGKYSECGFMGFDLDNDKVKQFLNDWELFHTSGEFVNLRETHDSYIFDHLRKICKDQSIFFDINHLSSTDKNPFSNSLLGSHMVHAKGRDKICDTHKLKNMLVKS